MVSFLTVINMTGNTDHKAHKPHKTDFETRFENFHDKHPEPEEIFPIEGSYRFMRSTNCKSRFLMILKANDTVDNYQVVEDMLLLKQSLELKFGESNVYLVEGQLGWISIYLFFDLEELLSRTCTR